MKARKKKTTAILSIVLVAVIAIGGTLAYLATKTEEKTNVFTFADNIRARLDEPNWKPEDAKNLTPGYEVYKDPMITNTSNNGVSEFVAIKVTFAGGKDENAPITLSGSDVVRLLNCLEITWNFTDWDLQYGTLNIDAQDVVTAATSQLVFVYKQKLAPGGVTNPLFSSVTIKEDISDADYAWLAAIIMNHTDDCYEYPDHDSPTYVHTAGCTVTYLHHVNCALFKDATNTESAIEATPGGQVCGSTTCDCTPAEEHSLATCADRAGVLNCTDSSHTLPAGALGGYQIKVQGAAVQVGVENMDNWNDTATITNLKALFGF